MQKSNVYRKKVIGDYCRMPKFTLLLGFKCPKIPTYFKEMYHMNIDFVDFVK